MRKIELFLNTKSNTLFKQMDNRLKSHQAGCNSAEPDQINRVESRRKVRCVSERECGVCLISCQSRRIKVKTTAQSKMNIENVPKEEERKEKCFIRFRSNKSVTGGLLPHFCFLLAAEFFFPGRCDTGVTKRRRCPFPNYTNR